MRIAVVSLFPVMLREALMHGVLGRAMERGLLAVECFDPRDHATDVHRTVDDRPYGGGPGMVLKVEPLRAALGSALASVPAGSRRVYLGADGRRFDQGTARAAREWPGLVLVAGRYEGVDERFIESEIDEVWSIGDYVLSGGELPALVVIDAIGRLIPGVLGSAESAVQESFSDGLLDWPHYTRPPSLGERAVPAALTSGDHAAIQRWRLRQALGRTWLRRPELLEQRGMSGEERQLLEEFKIERAERAGRTV
jgi:tRNA (guanine37-N1)-methyltransferase